MTMLSELQQRALALDKNISVTAGAGSGKTRILVERYLKIVLQNPARLRRVLAFTFTNKAAGEMQERIAADVLARLSATTDAQERMRLLTIRDQLNSASISTIHGFCARVLREFPMEAGIAPDFQEMDEIRQSILQQEAIKKVFDLINNGEMQGPAEDWQFFFSRLPRNTVSVLLQEALSKPYEMLQISERMAPYDADSFLEFLYNQWRALFAEELDRLDSRHLRPALSIILQRDGPLTDHEKALAVWEWVQQADHALANHPGSMETAILLCRGARLLTAGKGTAYKNLAQLGSQKSWPATAAGSLLTLSRLFEPLSGRLLELKMAFPDPETDRRWFQLMQIFLRLYDRVSGVYQQQKHERGFLDFEDLQLFTWKLLRTHPRIGKELYERYDHILVDEFQDTNALQWEIIQQVASRDGQLNRDKIFVVGDPKQSIYGFRDADIRIFRQVKESFARQFGHAHMDDYAGNVRFEESYRFLPRLNAFINFLFSGVLQESRHNAYAVGYSALDSKRQLPGKGWMELALLPAGENGVQTETEYLAQTIRRLIVERHTFFQWSGSAEQERPLEYGHIAILLRQRTHLLEVEQTLRRYGIPFKTAGGIGFWQRQEIFDLYHLLRFLSNTHDDFALVALLRSKLFMISDPALFFLQQEAGHTYWQKLCGELTADGYSTEDRNKLEPARHLIHKWIQLSHRLPLSELLPIIVSDVDLLAILAAQPNGEQLVANIQKLMVYVQDYDMTGPGGITDFLNYLDTFLTHEMREGEAALTLEDSGTVKIMTIHAAKGLQFPVVFLPFLNQRIQDSRSKLLLDTDLGLATRFDSGDMDEAQSEHLLYTLLKHRQRQKDNAEARRIFYVGASRASNYLFLSAALKDEQKIEGESALRWIHEAFSAQGIELLTSDRVQRDDFELIIRRGAEAVADSERETRRKGETLALLRKDLHAGEDAGDAPPDYLTPIRDEVGALTFSATRLMTYLREPQEYLKRYHLGFFEQDYESFAARISGDDYALLKGKIIHRLLELLPLSNQPIAALIDNTLSEFDVFDSDLRRQWQQEFADLLQRIHQSPTGRSILQAAEYRNEIVITSRLGTDYFTGTLDRLYRNQEGNWEVVDYKTNRIGRHQVEQEAAHYEWQIKSYAFLLSKLFPQQESFPVSIYFIHPDQLVRRDFSRKDTAEIGAFFHRTIEEIKNTFPLKAED